MGHQPMCSPTGRYAMVFNGEVYNFKEIRRELERKGHAFRGHSDTEVILSAFEAWGVAQSLPRFVGMFAISVWDSQTRTLTLTRDRLGIKPLYVYSKPGLVMFGSELKALVAGPHFDKTINADAVAEYLRYLYISAPRSIYEHVIKLPPGHVLTITDPRAPLPPSQAYWSLEAVARTGQLSPFSGTPADAVQELEKLLLESIRLRMISDVPLGALLSGGVDSSTVVSLMQSLTNRPVQTYTIGFVESAFDESLHAERVARHLQTEQTTLCLSGEDALNVVPSLPSILDEPLADPSAIPTYLVSALARRNVIVALSGDGGDELFAGYNRHIYGRRFIRALSALPKLARRSVAKTIQRFPPHVWDSWQRRAAGVLPASTGRFFGERLHKVAGMLSSNTPTAMYRALQYAWPEPESLISSEILMSSRSAAPSTLELLEQMLFQDQESYLPDDLLAKVDRTSMSVGLEARVPLLDHRIVEFSWRLPAELKVRGGVTKWILRQVLHKRVPESLIDRPKMGFSVPIAAWLRGQLLEWSQDLIGSRTLEQVGLRRGAVESAWNSFLARRMETGLGMWAVLNLLSWADTWAPTSF